MKNKACEESIVFLVAQPGEVSGVIARWSGSGLDLDADDVPGVEFDHDIDFVSTVVLPQVMQRAAMLADGGRDG